MDSQEEDQPSSSRRRKKRGRTSESDKAPKKKAKSEDVDALIEETSQSDQTRMEQAKVIDVPQPKKDQFKAKLNEIFMSEHAQVRALQMTIFYGGIGPFSKMAPNFVPPVFQIRFDFRKIWHENLMYN